MRLQTDRRTMFFAQQMPIILVGSAMLVFMIVLNVLSPDGLFSFDAPFISFIVMAGGVFLIYAALRWICPFELIVCEEGFSFREGKREGAALYADIAEMGYATVTHYGKATEYIRLYIIFAVPEKSLYLPNITKEKEGGWAEISECLAHAYTHHTGKDLTEGVCVPA
jgi:hypothetical protein